MYCLVIAKDFAPSGGMSGRVLAQEAERSTAFDDRFKDEQHVMRMVRELEAKGYATLRELCHRKNDPLRPEFLFVNITARGLEVWNGGDPTDDDIDDQRGANDPEGVKP